MSGDRTARIAAQAWVCRCAAVAMDRERPLSGISEAMDKLALAARDLTNIISESPPDERPEGWDTSPGGDTA